MNAVIYARYSSDSQREESIEGQLRECGDYAQRNGMTVVGSYIDRALSAKTADRPEFQRMEKNKRAPAHTKAKESEFLLTTKLFCGKCERMMVGESGKSHTGAMHYYYKCGNAKRKKGCDKKAVKKDWIERAVVRLTMERVLNEEKINRIIDALLVMQERVDVTIPALRRQLVETEKGIKNMLAKLHLAVQPYLNCKTRCNLSRFY